MAQDTPMSGFGTQSGSDMNTAGTGSSAGIGNDVCPHCGASKSANRGLEQFLGRLGVNDDMIRNIKSSMQNVDVEQYLDTARTYLRTGSDKAKNFAEENPGKVAAGVAALAVGAGLLISALNRDRDER